VYALFACWQVLGVWERIESALIGAADAQGKLSWQASVDSTTARAHVHAAGARRDSVNLVAGEPDHLRWAAPRVAGRPRLTWPSTSAAA
jgi:transposase